jgi:23S rRNA A1618 N6-methylase RlmF
VSSAVAFPSHSLFPLKGGEVEFVGKMIEDSKSLRDRVHVYTSMVGCKASLKPLCRRLQENSLSFCTTSFVQVWRQRNTHTHTHKHTHTHTHTQTHAFMHSQTLQGKTHRWAVAWTYAKDLDLSPLCEGHHKPKRKQQQQQQQQQQQHTLSFSIPRV